MNIITVSKRRETHYLVNITRAPFMASRMLNEASLVTEAVTTILPHTVEVGLVFSVTTVVVATIFIKSEIIVQNIQFCES